MANHLSPKVENNKETIKERFAANEPVASLARSFGVTPITMRNALVRWGVLDPKPRFTRYEIQPEAIADSPWLDYLADKAYMCDNHMLYLVFPDEELDTMNQLRQALHSTHRIDTHRNKWRLRISNMKLYEMVERRRLERQQKQQELRIG
jgi:hypothetical protein